MDLALNKASRKLQADYGKRLQEIDDQIERLRWTFRNTDRSDIEYWSARRAFCSYKLELNRLRQKLLLLEMAAEATEEDKKRASLTALGHLSVQESRPNDGDQTRRNFSQISTTGYTTCQMTEIAITVVTAPPIISRFKSRLLEVMKPEHPDRALRYYMCPVTGTWHRNLVAAHFFPWQGGKATMKAIFGPSQDPIMKSDLFSPLNGILWSPLVNDLYNAGLFTIVPDISAKDKPTSEEIETWQAHNLKEYKIRILDFSLPEMDTWLSSDDQVRDLDGRRLQFQTSWRPAAKYFYFAYCEAMLRQSYRATPGARIRWGCPGEYMKKCMLLPFVEVLGDLYMHLMEGTMLNERRKGKKDEESGLVE